jgi:hypothetical protein
MSVRVPKYRLHKATVRPSLRFAVTALTSASTTASAVTSDTGRSLPSSYPSPPTPVSRPSSEH